jgi:hypothetical protein
VPDPLDRIREQQGPGEDDRKGQKKKDSVDPRSLLTP